jgi:hypothetical protein
MARQPGVGLGAPGLRRSSLTLFESLKRLGGDEDGFGFPVVQQASNGIVKTSSYIRPFVFLTLGNVFPSEAVGQIVEFNSSGALSDYGTPSQKSRGDHSSPLHFHQSAQPSENRQGSK